MVFYYVCPHRLIERVTERLSTVKTPNERARKPRVFAFDRVLLI